MTDLSCKRNSITPIFQHRSLILSQPRTQQPSINARSAFSFPISSSFSKHRPEPQAVAAVPTHQPASTAHSRYANARLFHASAISPAKRIKSQRAKKDLPQTECSSQTPSTPSHSGSSLADAPRRNPSLLFPLPIRLICASETSALSPLWHPSSSLRLSQRLLPDGERFAGAQSELWFGIILDGFGAR